MNETRNRLHTLKSSIDTSQAPHTPEAIRGFNELVVNKTPTGEGLYASNAPVRTLWTSLWDTQDRRLAIDFYISEEAVSGSIQVERSANGFLARLITRIFFRLRYDDALPL